MPAGVDDLVRLYSRIDRERMQGLPIINPRLTVEAVGFRDLDEHRLGILITPWFMNLVLLPGNDDWDAAEPGSAVEYPLPNGDYEFRVCRDAGLGTYLTTILFRTVTDFPDQSLATEVAQEILEQLFAAREQDVTKAVSRRSLLTGMETR